MKTIERVKNNFRAKVHFKVSGGGRLRGCKVSARGEIASLPPPLSRVWPGIDKKNFEMYCQIYCGMVRNLTCIKGTNREGFKFFLFLNHVFQT